MKQRFTLPELLVVTAILLILVGMLVPALARAIRLSRHINFCSHARTQLDLKEDVKLLSIEEFCGVYETEAFHPELMDLCEGKKKFSETTIPIIKTKMRNIGKTVKVQSGDLYQQWSVFTGNPQKLSRQQFNILREKDLIEELHFDTWDRVTGNPQELSKEQFEALKANNAISFPMPKESVTNEGW